MVAVAEVKASWWSSNGHKFFAAAVATAVAVVLVGWLTDAREVMHDALISIAVVALLPFAVVAIGLVVALLVTLALSLPVALLDGDVGDVAGGVVGEAAGELAIEGGGEMLPRYYGFFARQRHPIFWGIPAGVLLGALVLWGALALTRLPRERETAQTLQNAKADIDRYYQRHGLFPEPLGGLLVIGGRTYVDGFGNPLRYTVKGAWKLAVWTLRSDGHDEKPSDDDLCISGESKLVELVDRTIEDKYDIIQALRCK